jgi:hypothetical protein
MDGIMGKMQRRIVRAINRENGNYGHKKHGPANDGNFPENNELQIAHKSYIRRLVRRQNRRDEYNRKILRSKTFFSGIIKKIRQLFKGGKTE